MSYDWNTTPIADGDRIDDPTVLSSHLAAVQERANIFSPGTILIGVGGSVGATVVAGTDNQTSEWWARYPSAAEQASPPAYWGMQAALGHMVQTVFWVDHRITYEGYTTALNGPPFAAIAWTMPNLRSAGSLPTLFEYVNVTPPDASGYLTPPNPPTANSTWRRKCPREVYNYPFSFGDDLAYVDLYDFQGNPATAGQHGWRLDGIGTLLYDCTAPGTWVRSSVVTSGTTTVPIIDVLDNASDYPNTVCCAISPDLGTFLGGFALVAYPDGITNMASPGDYRGAWLFDEVRTITNLLRWQAQWPTASPTSYYASVTSAISYADAVSKLAAAWGPGVPGGGSTPGRGSGAYVDAIYSGGTWFITAQRWETTQTVSGLPSAHKQIDTYLYGLPATGGSTPTFDAQGDGLSNGSYHKIDTSAIITATSYTTPTFGALTLPPHNPADPATAGNVRLGYYAADNLAIIRYDVTGGLVYLF